MAPAATAQGAQRPEAGNLPAVGHGTGALTTRIWVPLVLARKGLRCCLTAVPRSSGQACRWLVIGPNTIAGVVTHRRGAEVPESPNKPDTKESVQLHALHEGSGHRGYPSPPAV